MLLFRPETGSAREIRPKIPVGTKKYVEGDFGYGESEYEVRFGLAPRNGELLPSDPRTFEPFNSPFRFGPGTELRFELSAKFGVGGPKLGVHTRFPTPHCLIDELMPCDIVSNPSKSGAPGPGMNRAALLLRFFKGKCDPTSLPNVDQPRP